MRRCHESWAASVQVSLWVVASVFGSLAVAVGTLPVIAQEEPASDEFLVLNDEFNARPDVTQRLVGTDTNVYDFNVNLIGNFSTGSIDHQLVFGVDWGEFTRTVELFTGTAAPIDLFAPIYEQPLSPFSLAFNGVFYRSTLGIYVQDQVTLTDNLNLLLGGRFDLSTETSRNFVAGTETRQTSDAFSPRIGIVYQPIEPISLYASYSRSFTPLSGTTFEGDLFQPERGTQYEAGVKADINDQLSATLAFYDLTRSNVLTPDNRPGVPPDEFEIQTREQRSRGIELNVQGEILPGWNILAGYAYTDAQITEDNAIPTGNRLSNVPENAFSLWTSYEIQSGDFQGLGVGLGLFFVGERPIDLENSVELPSYLRTDASIFYRRDRFRAALNFRNLFDVDYFESALSTLRVYRGTPFTVQGTISWEF
ncbi:TonB-dependent siderophore receptor [Leptolyngbya sp. NK1-12]|uniref:TonB-dependent siderophore receptor n=1 Tax=Leptolyngbya sp. NK1-12 TaxID=2547451 RepID=A0AA96WAS2_9CYAN|nr:TonB-dependent siderophore receptor [Leptolyngbya sp. NK1-12]